MNKKIPAPLAILIILLVTTIIVGVAFWFCPEKEIVPPQDETADWKTYSNPEVNFTLKYPKDWEITGDYFYETATGIKSEKRTVVLQKVGNQDSNNWIRINPRQFQCNPGKCIDIDGNTIATYSKEPEIQDIFNQMLSTFRFTEETPQTISDPVIESISPNFGPIGTEVEIRGKNFSGFEGDLVVWIEDVNGEKGYIWREAGSNDTLIKFTLSSSYCQVDTSYSGLPCPKFIYLTPGTYKIYVYPWGVKSNEVTFTVNSQ